jgi:nucleolar protein 14
MSLEERMLERFTKERQRSSRGTAFNLEDEDELTHYGQSLSKLDDFDNAGLRLDDEEEEIGATGDISTAHDSNFWSGQMDPNVVGKTHFQGFSDDEDDDEDDQVRLTLIQLEQY